MRQVFSPKSKNKQAGFSPLCTSSYIFYSIHRRYYIVMMVPSCPVDKRGTAAREANKRNHGHPDRAADHENPANKQILHVCCPHVPLSAAPFLQKEQNMETAGRVLSEGHNHLPSLE